MTLDTTHNIVHGFLLLTRIRLQKCRRVRFFFYFLLYAVLAVQYIAGVDKEIKPIKYRSCLYARGVRVCTLCARSVHVCTLCARGVRVCTLYTCGVRVCTLCARAVCVFVHCARAVCMFVYYVRAVCVFVHYARAVCVCVRVCTLCARGVRVCTLCACVFVHCARALLLAKHERIPLICVFFPLVIVLRKRERRTDCKEWIWRTHAPLPSRNRLDFTSK